MRLPHVLFFTAMAVVEGGVCFDRTRLSWNPSIVHLPNFLNASACESIRSMAQSKLHYNEDVQWTAPGKRSSSGVWFPREEERQSTTWNPLLLKIHDFVGLSPDHGSNFKVSRYKPGEKYTVHADAKPGMFRSLTFLGYLNTPLKGGHTIFPRLLSNGMLSEYSNRSTNWLNRNFKSLCKNQNILSIVPRAGDAVVFAPLTPWMEINPLADHASCPVYKGEKYVVQRWFQPFANPNWHKNGNHPW